MCSRRMPSCRFSRTPANCATPWRWIPGVDRIQAGPGEDRLYLINSAGNQIQELNLTFILEIPVDGSPTKGSLDAAVAVVVFTDFQ